ncbi:MAG: toll/interleukin-1 receptor domain-containing protein, partial [Anaerolinea sp.]|nr:toll/interleukin-1 receptor domain-containing protein [Anaerolinea sp.]
MAGSHCFISYSTADGIDFAIRLHDALESGPPPIQSWVDKRDLRPGEDWEKQIVSAIQSCFAFVFVMTTDSVAYESVCRAEWSRALKYRKPIIPLLFDENVEPPLRLENHQWIDFANDFDAGIAKPVSYTHLRA